MMWSDYVNGDVYQFVAFILQASQAHNITIDGGAKYNVPSGNIVIDRMGNTSPPNLTSYTPAAVIGADDFNDDDATIRGGFDLIVNITRQVTPACTFLDSLSSIFLSLTFAKSSRNCMGPWVWIRVMFRGCFLMKMSTGSIHIDGPPARLNASPSSPLSNSRTQFSSSETPCVHVAPSPEMNRPDRYDSQADPITPFANANKAANLLGDNGFLLEHLGFGHTSIAQFSSCTLGIMNNYFANSTVVVPLCFCRPYVLIDFPFFQLPNGRSTQCPVDDANLFPVLSGNATVRKRSGLPRRWLW